MIGVHKTAFEIPVKVMLSQLSASLSFARTSMRTSVFREVVSRSGNVRGASLTQLTTNDPVAVFERAPLASMTL